MESWLAAAHYLAIFVTFALLVGGVVLLRPEPAVPCIKLLSRLDIGYGVFAGVVIATGPVSYTHLTLPTIYSV